MPDITIDSDMMKYIAIFESLTDVAVKDVVELDDHLVFIVAEGHANKAIGKNGATIERVKKMLRKKVRAVEFSKDPKLFLMNIFRTFDPLDVELSIKGTVNHATVIVTTENKGRAIGKEGKNLRVARALVSRHHSIFSVSVSDTSSPAKLSSECE